MSDNIANEFKQEALELLTQLETMLLDLENASTDASLINRLFRVLHTLKGSSGMFGYEAVSAFAHHVESAFDLMRQGRIGCTAELIAATLSAEDYMRALIETPETADHGTGNGILRLLQQLSDENAQTPPAPLEAVERTWRLRMSYPAEREGADPLSLLDELRGLGTVTVVPLAGATQNHVGWDATLTTTQPREDIEAAFLFASADISVDIEAVQANESCLTPSPKAETTAAPILEAAPAQQPAFSVIKTPEGNGHMDMEHTDHDAHGHPPASRAGHAHEHSIRVPAQRLDELMNRVGELVIAQSRLHQIATNSQEPQVKSVAEEIERLVLELRDTSMGIRMVPIAQLFNRFRRVVHDLSRDLGKHVELTMEGEETELDKTVIEQINDPIVHLIRNAIDHGIEAPETRTRTGKNPSGAIKLSARHAGTEVLVTITDDGCGLNVERIRARAEERGLVDPNAAVSCEELHQLLFLPGFSTVSEVTSLSGRGVGMDVVKRTIEALRGKIDVESKQGVGTQFTLRLPLTLAIIDGLMVRVGQGRYVLPLETVEECVELSTEEDTRSRGRSLLNIRGDLVPFLRLRELFSAKTPPDRYQKVVVVSWGELKVGLVVDQVIGEHQTVIKSLSKLHHDIEMFSGATILGDGGVALILDVLHLVEYGQALEDRQKAVG